MPLQNNSTKLGPNDNRVLYDKLDNSALGKYKLTQEDLEDYKQITHFTSDIFRACVNTELTKVRHIDWPSFPAVRYVGDCLCIEMFNLEKFSYDPFPNVEEIRYSHLFGCKSLKELDFSPIAKTLKKFDVGQFLYDCRENVKFKGLHKLKNVELISTFGHTDVTWFQGLINAAVKREEVEIKNILLLSYKANNGKLGQMLNTHYAPRVLVAKFCLSQ